MFSSYARALVALSLLGAAPGCGNTAPPPLYPITLRVMSDSRPLPGAAVVIAGRELGATDAQGRFRMETVGVEGTSVEVVVRCPAGFRSPAQPLAVVLRSTVQLDQTQRGQGIETTAQCPPTQRIAAVVVRVPGRPNLPILYENREITRTDLQGIAHMIFRVGGGRHAAPSRRHAGAAPAAAGQPRARGAHHRRRQRVREHPGLRGGRCPARPATARRAGQPWAAAHPREEARRVLLIGTGNVTAQPLALAIGSVIG